MTAATPAPVFLAVGGNVGDVPARLHWVADQFAQNAHFGNVRLSRLYRTTPIGAEAGDPFVNAAITCTSTLDPEELLDFCQELERAAGRVRSIHWGPRTLDVDLLGHGQQEWTSPRLLLPHPRMWYRRFVLDPLVELEPDWIIPGRDATVAEFLARLQRRPLKLLIGPSVAARQELLDDLRHIVTPDEVQIGCSETDATADTTWCLLDPQIDPGAWEQANRVNRLSTADWDHFTIEDLLFVMRSSLDAPTLLE